MAEAKLNKLHEKLAKLSLDNKEQLQVASATIKSEEDKCIKTQFANKFDAQADESTKA